MVVGIKLTFAHTRLDQRLHNLEGPGSVRGAVGIWRLGDVDTDGDVSQLPRYVEQSRVHLVEGGIVILRRFPISFYIVPAGSFWGRETTESILSWTAFQSAVVFSFERDMICCAFPFRTKSAYTFSTYQPVSLVGYIHICRGPTSTEEKQQVARWHRKERGWGQQSRRRPETKTKIRTSLALLRKVSPMSQLIPSLTVSRHGSEGWYRSMSRPTARLRSRTSSWWKLEHGRPKYDDSRGRSSDR